MNKPKDYVTTVEDPHAEHTVLDLSERVVPKESTLSEGLTRQQQEFFCSQTMAILPENSLTQSIKEEKYIMCFSIAR